MFRISRLFAAAAALVFFPFAAAQAQFAYPETRQTETIDTYFGTQVADPYRWLEDDYSEETKAWVKAQNEVTFGYLEQIPFRQQWLDRLVETNNYPKYSSPFRNNEYYYFYKNDGLQNQSVLYRQQGLAGEPELVIDPNQLSEEGTTSLAVFSLSKDGKYAVVGISEGGSDWRTMYVRDMSTGQNLADEIKWAKVTGLSWQGHGFYYSRYPQPEPGKELSTKNENHQVYYHRVGTPQSEDVLVYEDPANPQRFHGVFTSEDEQFSFLNISDRGRGKQGNALWYRASTDPAAPFKPLIAEPGEHSYGLVDVVEGKLLISTNDDAPNRRVIVVDPQKPERENWQILIAEQPEPLTAVSSAGGKLFLRYSKDVTTRVYVYSFQGELEREVQLPSLGTAGGFGGKRDEKQVFYTFTSFAYPPSIYTYDIASGKSTLFRSPEVAFNPEDYETKQVFYPSKDGTKVPMFIVHKKGLELNGQNPTILYAYGGFNISVNPSFSMSRISWLEQGGIYASANLRGGSEYGEAWHQAGMRLKKQNVFDDFIAAAEYLIENQYTSTPYLACQGGSNGGLLVGAVINQRPDLFGVAIPQVGVMDMLRFQQFTIGWNWIAEYGSAEATEEDFKNLYAYSPLHNIQPGVTYPATLITTADHDDRVVPAHSFKYAAELQAKANNDRPLLIRIETESGHGASNLRKALEGVADIYAFCFFNMGLTPRF
jgi:prolyl oligopeptidase